MSQDDLSLTDVVARAYSRAIQPAQFVRLLQRWRESHAGRAETVGPQLADILLRRMTGDHPPSIILAYLSTLVEDNTLSARVIATQLLFVLGAERTLSVPTLTSIASIILSRPAGLEGPELLPTSLSPPSTPIPDIGTSASATPPPSTSTSTLGLLIPLLRLCSDGSAPPNSSVVQLTSRLLSLLPSYPPPPLDEAITASQLSEHAPPAVALPLKNALSGLMDIATAQESDVVQNLGVTISTGAYEQATDYSAVHGLPRTVNMSAISGSHSTGSNMPVHHAVRFLLAYLQHAAPRTSNTTGYRADPPIPSAPERQVILLGKELGTQPSVFLESLLRETLLGAVNIAPDASVESSMRWGVLVERLPLMLRWWAEQSGPKWAYPYHLSDKLTVVFAEAAEAMNKFDQQVQTLYEGLSSIMTDDDSGSVTRPAGWDLASVRETLVRRFASIGLLERDEALELAPGVSLSTVDGESLLFRYASSAWSHLPALRHFILYGSGTADYFAKELVKCIIAMPSTLPPDGLFPRLAADPSVLSAVASHLPPLDLLALLERHALSAQDDSGDRLTDPQGFLTKFGENVALVENVVRMWDLPPPPLLRDARTALNLADLTVDERNLVGGWIKALFGPDGIDDQTLLATTPQDFCRLSCCIIQQVIQGAITGHIELDTVHNGLSYFSQDLLRWSVGGLVSWLCKEIQRQGPLAGVHLNILSVLLCADNFSENVLRANIETVREILDQTSRFVPVVMSSQFDTATVQAKIDSLVPPAPSPVLDNGTPPLLNLRNQLQLVRQLDNAPPTWADTLLAAVNRAVTAHSPSAALRAVIDEAISTIPVPNQASETLVHLVPLLSVASVVPGRRKTLAASLPDVLVDLASRSLTPEQNIRLALIIRRIVAALTETAVESHAGITSEVVDELLHLRTQRRARLKQAQLRPKRPRTTSGLEGLDFDFLCERVVEDDDLVSAVPALRRLQ